MVSSTCMGSVCFGNCEGIYFWVVGLCKVMWKVLKSKNILLKNWNTVNFCKCRNQGTQKLSLHYCFSFFQNLWLWRWANRIIDWNQLWRPRSIISCVSCSCYIKKQICELIWFLIMISRDRKLSGVVTIYSEYLTDICPDICNECYNGISYLEVCKIRRKSLSSLDNLMQWRYFQVFE